MVWFYYCKVEVIGTLKQPIDLIQVEMTNFKFFMSYTVV